MKTEELERQIRDWEVRYTWLLFAFVIVSLCLVYCMF